MLIIALLLPNFCYSAAEIEPDKKLHFGVSATLSAASYTTLRGMGMTKTKCLWWSMGVTLLVGALKELTDEQPDSADMAYNIGGSSLGVSLPFFISDF